jgi:hypothetical protein
MLIAGNAHTFQIGNQARGSQLVARSPKSGNPVDKTAATSLNLSYFCPIYFYETHNTKCLIKNLFPPF